ncbi:acetyltransferase (GNAT) family protein [Aliiruegeria haliotis]|uniref:Acetyltransferase (GNAT) family protein n=1 Tax=Aliiruegeria haliotis TaxID=1280846 RepID=A0A2T0RNE2_9RHOB|nr:GNAT family N-acetyltransferase [Aliiruegeria haliotis]PRY22633.1 acetyltransferase (GNAT) family protein [Aliiruegeria haliotis]
MIRLRTATIGDVPEMAAILQTWLDQTPWMPDLHRLEGTKRFVARLLETTEAEVACGSEVDGFLCLEGAEIPALYVAESARSRGVGSALIVEAQARRTRLCLWTFQANSRARRFYARHGFLEVEATDGAGNEEKLPDVRLEWSRT